MKVSVLFSGGKDSSMAAILLEPFFEVELVTCNFSLLPTGEIAAEVASRLELPHRIFNMDSGILESAYEMIMRDGFPKNAINYIHQKAIESLALEDGMKFIADGTRRDDRVPVLTASQIQSIEDRFSVSYLCPLQGYGRNAVNQMVKNHLMIREALSDDISKADYEAELRELIKLRHGVDSIEKLFPPHVQSKVIERIK
ncbi:protein of unknown function DUF71 ATP-binding region [Methanosalsum zhilinae DSM 4017]|uniref:Alpha hydrolase n=1 Tax=Methanosalsum zhilinae (strain DSM 4017 / NBRC 107636 / OCM 62 / WeN5) TaxID=679901 RepID=F7XQ42_METZD|nr:alpha hydrolase [Methanosalsum zhilinae]AEH60403.1 protein of unknown function DUF71 ATP-binding region [Methanosalsum zhilinae DSM 4017]